MATRNTQNNNDSVPKPTGSNAEGSDAMEEDILTEEDVRNGDQSHRNKEATRQAVGNGAGDGAPLMSWESLQADEETGDGDLDRSIETELGEGEGENVRGTEWTVKKEDQLIDLYEQCKFL